MKMCDESCEHCIYIGEGDYTCDKYDVIVIEDFNYGQVCLEGQEHDQVYQRLFRVCKKISI